MFLARQIVGKTHKRRCKLSSFWLTHTQRNYGCQATTQSERTAQIFPSLSAVVITVCEVTALQVSRNIRLYRATSDWSSMAEMEIAQILTTGCECICDLRLLMCEPLQSSSETFLPTPLLIPLRSQAPFYSALCK